MSGKTAARCQLLYSGHQQQHPAPCADPHLWQRPRRERRRHIRPGGGGGDDGKGPAQPGARPRRLWRIQDRGQLLAARCSQHCSVGDAFCGGAPQHLGWGCAKAAACDGPRPSPKLITADQLQHFCFGFPSSTTTRCNRAQARLHQHPGPAAVLLNCADRQVWGAVLVPKRGLGSAPPLLSCCAPTHFDAPCCTPLPSLKLAALPLEPQGWYQCLRALITRVLQLSASPTSLPPLAPRSLQPLSPAPPA